MGDQEDCRLETKKKKQKNVFQRCSLWYFAFLMFQLLVAILFLSKLAYYCIIPLTPSLPARRLTTRQHANTGI